MRSSHERLGRSIMLAVGTGLLGGLMLVAGIGAAPLSPARAAAAASRAAPKCVPLEDVPFGPPSEQGHHVTGTGVEDGPLGLYAFLPEGVFRAGQSVDIRLEVRNAGDAPIAFSFATSQRDDAVIWDDNCKEVWRWSSGRMFAQMVGSVTVPAHGKIVYHVAWSQRDQAGHQVRTGGYEAQVVFLGTGPQSSTPVVLPPLTFAVR